MSLAYALRLALRSLRRDVAHTVIMIVVLALGLTASTSATTVLVQRGGSAPGGSSHLYQVAIDRTPDGVRRSGSPDLPEPLAFRDRGLLNSTVPSRATDVFVGSGIARTSAGAPIGIDVVFCTRHFASMLGLPLGAGATWSERADRGEETAVILSEDAARAIFGAEPAVGREARIFGEAVPVVGVARPRRAPASSSIQPRPAVLMPSALAERFGVRPALFVRHDDAGPSYRAFLASESTWIRLWVELDGPDARARYEAELDAYVRGERARGRPLDHARLIAENAARRARTFDSGTVLFVLFAHVLLAGAVLVVVRMLDGKRRARAVEIAVHRAFGAARTDVIAEHLVEAELVAMSGGVLSIATTLAMLRLLNGLMVSRPLDYRLDAVHVAISLAGAVVLGLVAGAYPAARAARYAPAEGLRRS